MKDSEIQTVSILGTVVLSAALFAPILYLVPKAEASGPELKEMETIEASLAYRKTPQKQPQKRLKAADPVEKPEGVSHDENKKVEKKDDEKKPKKDDQDPLAKFKHPQDDDSPTGKPVTDIGQFNGDEKGFADETKGDPWMQQLAADLNYQPPEIAKGNGVPVGCVHITADGKISDTKFFTRTDDDLQTAAEAALAGLKKTRNDKPVEVPTHLLKITTRWLCFKFNVRPS